MNDVDSSWVRAVHMEQQYELFRQGIPIENEQE
jgi:hypothetical protein